MHRSGRILVTTVLLLLLIPVLVAAQDWAGKGRAEGQVVDPAGEPIEGARVTLRSASSPDEGPETLITSSKGRWSFLGMQGGPWVVVIEADGYLVSQGRFSVSEFQRAKPMRVVMEPNPAASIGVGDELMAAGDYAGARMEYNKAIGALDAQTQGRLRSRIGETYMLEGNYAGARAEYEQAMSAVGPDEQSHILLALGNTYQLEENYTKAREIYEKTLPLLSPEGQAQVLVTIAQGYGKQDNVTGAIAALQRAEEAAPGNPSVLQLLADLLMREGRDEEAAEVMARLPEDVELPTDMVLNMGIRLYNEGNTEEALQYFERAAVEHPDEPQTYYYRGLVYLSQGRNDDAKADFHRLLELAPNSDHKAEVEEFLKFLEQGS